MSQVPPTKDRPACLSPDEQGIARACGLLEQGELVALPTETVYGLGADARNNQACAKIFEAKGRPTFNPLIVHVADLAQVAQIAEVTDTARILADRFWPGPLTLVFRLRPDHVLSPVVSAGLPTVAIRIPNHPVAQNILRRFGGPIAAPSANRSGRLSPTSAEHVAQSLGNRIAAIVDGGPCPVGLESSIVDASQKPAKLLREGGIAQEEISALTGALVSDLTPGRVAAPGQMSSHYAPNAPLRINQDLSDPTRLRIAFGPIEDADFTLSEQGDLREAAAALFSILHHADAELALRGKTGIDVASVPQKGLGLAINDRLMRAAAPRD